MMAGGAIAIVAIYVWRLFFSAWAVQVVGRERILLVGGSPLLEDIGRHVEAHPEAGLEVAGYVDDTHVPGALLPGDKMLGALA